MKFWTMLDPRFMRDHHWTKGHLSEYIDHDLDDLERERVERHVGRCPSCHRLLASLRRVVAGLGSLGREVRPARGPVADGVLERFRSEV